MKIGILATSFFGCPNPRYGGAERMSWNLACGLTARGHKVILYAPDNSQKPPNGFLFKTGPALDTVNVNWVEEEREDWNNIKHTFDDLDIIMGDAWFGFEYASKSENPSLNACHRHHGHLNYEFWGKSAPPFKLNMIAISKWMKHCFETGYDGKAPMKIPSKVCYNGVAIEEYPYKENKGNRLLFLGRIDPVKGPHHAIDVAEKTKAPIDIVGATSFVANEQYVLDIKARCQQSLYANFIGEVSHPAKLEFLQNAKALIACSSFGEPFGLHFVEALASGTPVISTRDGAAPEIVEHGESGFIANDVNEMVDLISLTETIMSTNCRKRATQFSQSVMARRMEELYNLILEGQEW